MSKPGRDPKQKLFDLYSHNLMLYASDVQDTFYCPLCLKRFTREALDGPEPALTLAHVVSKSLGGRFCTLSCKECNNDAGSGLEAYLVEQLAVEDWMAGVTRKDARVSGPFGNIGVSTEFLLDERTFSLQVVPEQSNRTEVKALEQHLADLGVEPQGELKIRLKLQYRHRPRQVEAAIHQSAYLLMFSYFGYEFTCHPHFARLREQIVHPEKDIWESHIAVLERQWAETVLCGQNHAIVFLREPDALLAVLRLRPRRGRERVLGVVLPGLDVPALPSEEVAEFGGSTILKHPREFLLERKYSFQISWRLTRQRLEQTDQDDAE